MKNSDFERYGVFVFWVLICILGVVMLACLAQAFAGELPKNHPGNQLCINFATDIHTIASNRDAGRPIQDAKIDAAASLVQHVGEENSYVRFDSDVDFVVNLILMRFTSAKVHRT